VKTTQLQIFNSNQNINLKQGPGGLVNIGLESKETGRIDGDILDIQTNNENYGVQQFNQKNTTERNTLNEVGGSIGTEGTILKNNSLHIALD
jgi:hypothetical protein